MFTRPWSRLVTLVAMSAGFVFTSVGGAHAHGAGPAPATEENLARLRACESNGNYAATTGQYFGAYQFLAPTWRSLGHGGLPHHAPPELQDEAARHLHAREGWGQWPRCSRHLGLI
ncbi:MAG TPA: transglycosylase family protein [Acidimicrobiales bacterium]|nr:transglycosylase family protein [Acidimicrobiales bacterium]